MKQLLRIIIGIVWCIGFSQVGYTHPNIDDNAKNPRSGKKLLWQLNGGV